MILKRDIIAIFRGNFDTSRYYAVCQEFRDLSRKTANSAIFRGKCQISRYRTHRDKYLPLTIIQAKDSSQHFILDKLFVQKKD